MKNKINDFFNLKLYLQALKRLRITGIVCFVCMAIIAIIAPIIDNLNISDPYIYGYAEPYMSSLSSHSIYIVASTSSYVFLPIVIYLIVPLMCLILFHFLTTRNGSDFYHSIPTKRRAVYLSLVGAVITWALIIIVGFSLIMTIMYGIFSDTIIVNGLSIFIYTCNVFISCILVAAVFALGCSLSGTLLSNLVTSLCILLMPRLFMTIFCALISYANPLVDGNGLFILTRYSCNMPFAAIIDSFSGTKPVLAAFSFSTLYTLILAVIYLVLGSIVYTKRPSEAAGKSAVSPKLQFAIRMILGYTVSFLVTAPAFIVIASKWDSAILDIESFIYVLCVFIGTFALMFIYELISSKGLKKALKSLLSAPLILVADVVTILILLLANNIILNSTPDAEDIKYVKFSFTDYVYSESIIDKETQLNFIDNTTDDYQLYEYYSSYFENDYIISKLCDIKITDPEMLELVANIMKENADNVKRWQNNSDYVYSVYGFSSDISVTVCDGLFETERYLLLSSSDMQTILKHIAEHEEAQNIYASLPDADDSNAIISSTGNLTEAQTESIYNTFKEELKALSPEEYHTISTYGNSIGVLTLRYCKNGNILDNQFSITNATPKTMALYMQYVNDNNEDAFLSDISNLEYYPSIELLIMDYETGNKTTYYEFGSSSNPQVTNLSNSIANAIDIFNANEINTLTDIDFNKYYVCHASVSYNEPYTEVDGYTYYDSTIFIDYYFLMEKDSGLDEAFGECTTIYTNSFYPGSTSE